MCGDADGHGLGCVPLPLFQTGWPIPQFNFSFAICLNLFKDDLQDIMKNKMDLKPIHGSKRSISTTWRIIKERLSQKACTM